MKAIWLGVLAAVATASGCAYESAYYDSTTSYPATNQQQAAPPVSSYSIPSTDPKGSVHVISLGAEQLPVPAGQPDSYVHLRIAAENRTDEAPWTVDPNDQVLSAGGAPVAASFAEASSGGPVPVLTLAKGAHGYLDLFYPAPPAGAATRVTLSWKIHRGNEVVPGSTDFDRVASPDPAYSRYEPVAGPHVYVGLGLGWWWPDYYWWGGPWWGRPWWGYPSYGYYGGFYGRGYYGGHGYYGGRGYYGGARGSYGGGRVYSPGAGSWRSGGGGATRATPSGGNSGGGRSAPSAPAPSGGGWRGGRR
jgi:hypothetical protein